MEQRSHPGYIVLNSNRYALSIERDESAEGVKNYPRDIVRIPRSDVIPDPGGLPNCYWKIWDKIGRDGLVGRSFDPERPRGVRFPTTNARGQVDASHRGGRIVLSLGRQLNDTWTVLGSHMCGFAEENGDLLLIDNRYSRTVTTAVTTLTVQNAPGEQDFQALAGGSASTVALGIPLHHQGDIFVGATESLLRRRAGTWSRTAIRTEHLALGPTRLYRSYLDTGVTPNAYTIQNCDNDDDPTTAGNWGNAVIVGDLDDAVNGLAIDGQTLVVGKTSGAYIVQEDGSVYNLTQEVFKESRNGRGMMNALSYVLYPTIQGLIAIKDSTVYYNVGPEYDSEECQFRFHSAVTRGSWLYAVFERSNDLHLFKARLRTSSDPAGGPFIWWPLLRQAISSNAGNHSVVWVSDVDQGSYTNAMLWLGTDGEASAYFLSRNEETHYSGLAADTSAYPTTGYQYFPEDDFGFPGNQKITTHALMVADNLASDPDARLTISDGSTRTASFTASGTMVAFDANAVARRYTGITLELDKRTTGAAYGPEVVLVAARFFVRPDYDRRWAYTFRLIDGMTLEQNIQINEDAATQYANLEALIENTATVTLEDEMGSTYSVLIHEPLERVRAGIDENTGRPFWDVRIQGSVL